MGRGKCQQIGSEEHPLPKDTGSAIPARPEGSVGWNDGEIPRNAVEADLEAEGLDAFI